MYGSTRSKPHEKMDVIGYLRGPAALTYQILSWVEPRDNLNTWENRKIFCPCREKSDFNYLIRSLITDLSRLPCSLTRDNRCVSLVLTSSSHVKNIQTAETCKCKSEDQRGKVRINVILRRVRVTIVAVEKQQYYIFWLCELSRMERTCAALHCHLWPVSIYRVFPYHVINGMILGGGGGVFSKKKFFFFFPPFFC